MTLASVKSYAPGVCLGNDFSSHQHEGGASVDWDEYARSGRSFVYIKSSEDKKLGPGGYPAYDNPYFEDDWNDAARIGIACRGVYHYVRPSTTSPADSITHLERMVESVGGLRSGDFVVLDSEEEVAQDQLLWHSEALDAAYHSTKLCRGLARPWLYSGLTFLQRHGLLVSGSTPTQYLYIHASYQKTLPPNPTGYKILMWQFTADQTELPGITGKIDDNVFLGSLDYMRSLCMP